MHSSCGMNHHRERHMIPYTFLKFSCVVFDLFVFKAIQANSSRGFPWREEWSAEAGLLNLSFVKRWWLALKKNKAEGCLIFIFSLLVASFWVFSYKQTNKKSQPKKTNKKNPKTIVFDASSCCILRMFQMFPGNSVVYGLWFCPASKGQNQMLCLWYESVQFLL